MNSLGLSSNFPDAEIENPSRKAASEIQLPRVSDLLAAGPLHQILMSALNEGGSLIINASQVERISTACLQLLVATRKCVEAGGGSMTLHDPSQTAIEAIAELGLTDSLLSGGKSNG